MLLPTPTWLEARQASAEGVKVVKRSICGHEFDRERQRGVPSVLKHLCA